MSDMTKAKMHTYTGTRYNNSFKSKFSDYFEIKILMSIIKINFFDLFYVNA